MCETSHNIAWEDSKIITTNNRYGQRLCLEAWHINAFSMVLTYEKQTGKFTNDVPEIQGIGGGGQMGGRVQYKLSSLV